MWHFFDKIYCISLRQRSDRRQEAEQQFVSVGLSGLVEFHIVDKHHDNPEQGIYESHINCLKKGLESGAERILIFEDDILFHRFDPDVLRNGIVFMSTYQGWNMVLLGGMVKDSCPTDYPSVRRARYRSLAHASIFNHEFAARLAQRHWHGVPYDDFLRDLNDDKTFVLYPSFAFQSDSGSDNERYLPLDRIRRLLGGLRRLQRMNEIFHRYRMIIIFAHVAAAGGLLLWLSS